jgi:hypothetical protein
MWVTTYVKRHVFRLPKDQPFTTRDCLIYGVRSAVDQALYRLVKTGIIRRLARGIFVRDQKKYFTVLEIANIKAEAFGHKIMRHDFVIPSEVNNLATPIIEPKLFINSRSSQFCVDGKVIKLRGTADRKMKLDGGKAGQALKALWKMGRDNVNLDAITRATSGFTRTDRQEIIHYMKWLPAWLGGYFIKRDKWPFPLRNPSSPWPTIEPKILVRLL